MAQTIGDVMSGAIVTTPEAPLIDAVHVMASEPTSALPVVADGRLVGILTDRDIVVRGVAAGLVLQAASVGDVASSGLVYVRPGQPVGHALLLMAAHQLRRAATDAGLKPQGFVPMSRGNGERSRRRR